MQGDGAVTSRIASQGLGIKADKRNMEIWHMEELRGGEIGLDQVWAWCVVRSVYET